jgi:hypothetical protein
MFQIYLLPGTEIFNDETENFILFSCSEIYFPDIIALTSDCGSRILFIPKFFTSISAISGYKKAGNVVGAVNHMFSGRSTL